MNGSCVSTSGEHARPARGRKRLAFANFFLRDCFGETPRNAGEGAAGLSKPTCGTRALPGIRHSLALGLTLFATLHSFAAETIPPKPDKYFNDYAGVVSKTAADRFNEQLAQFERETSNQVVVAIFPKMESDSDIADYTVRVAQSWGVGQKGKNNGAVLFVFIQDRKVFIPTGYGLEGALPDVTAFDITEFHIKPHFRAGDYEAGLTEGIDLIQKAIRGEYKGSGKTVRETRGNSSGKIPLNLVVFIILVIIFSIANRIQRRRGYRYSRSGGPFVWFPSAGGSWGSGGGGWSSGGGGGGFSGFSGGGGSFGGGGAGSSW